MGRAWGWAAVVTATARPKSISMHTERLTATGQETIPATARRRVSRLEPGIGAADATVHGHKCCSARLRRRSGWPATGRQRCPAASEPASAAVGRVCRDRPSFLRGSSGPVATVPIMSMDCFGPDLNCSACGYGIAPRGRLPERCPMCGDSTSWIPRAAVAVPAHFVEPVPSQLPPAEA